MRKLCKNKRTAAGLCAGIVCAGLVLAGNTVLAEGESGQFHSKGCIRYRDAGGQEIILDAGDFDALFQYAAEGKGGLSEALGGIGTKLVRDGEGYGYTRDPRQEAAIGRVQTADEMRAIGFDLLIRALADSQTLPEGYEDTYTLAASDNMTLGRSAWADGSLLRGNNHDLIEHYMRGWLAGSGCADYEPIYDEEGRWIGYREKS